MMSVFRLLLVLVLSVIPALGATFGTAVQHPSPLVDLTYDSARKRLYVLNPFYSQTAGAVEVYDTSGRTPTLLAKGGTIPVDTNPVSMALSRTGRYLYVACYTSGVIDQIDLNTLARANTITLPANPEAVAIGFDDKLLISTTGAPQGQFVLATYDPNAGGGVNPLQSVTVAPPAPAIPTVPPPNGLPYLAVRAHLVATPDGQTIVGVHEPAGNTRTVFVYQVSSATVLRSRSVAVATGVLAVSPDGSRFLSGHLIFDTASLAVLAQQNATNAPFVFTPGANFNSLTTQGGAAFLPDGTQLLTSYNIPPLANPAPPANAAQLLVNTPDNMLVQLGLQLPQNLTGKMVATPDGATIYALSTSGFMVLPVSTLKPGPGSAPIAIPDSNVALLSSDQCGVFAGQNSAVIPVRNVGGGSLSVSAQLVATTANSATLRTTARPYGTDVTATFSPTAARTTLGTSTPDQLLLQSAQAVNIIPTVRVFQNFRNSETAGTVLPVDIGATATGLTDIVQDAARQRLYIANPGLNRIEVFDTQQKTFLAPISSGIGQLPRSLALGNDGNSLYVANSGGESLSLVHLDAKPVRVETINFPPLPFNAALGLITPQLVASSQRDPQVLMSDGTMWKVAGNRVTLRKLNPNIFGSANVIPGPQTMVSTPEGSYVLVLGGTGSAFLYSAGVDDIIAASQVIPQPITGFFGAVAAGPNGQYYLTGPQILDSSLTLVGSAPGAGGNGGIPLPVTTSRPVAAVAAVGGQAFARFTTPIRTNLLTPATDAGIIELVDTATQKTIASANVPEGPPATAIGLARANIYGRQMVVDGAGSTVYVVTASGLSVIPINQAQGAAPQVSAGGVVNMANFQGKVATGSLISIFGRNLASGASAPGTPLPSILGGVCVTLSNTPMPLFSTSAGQINAQVPPGLAPANYTVVVRSVDNLAASSNVTVAVARYAPAIFVDQNGPAIFHQNGERVDKDHPANRDEPLTIYATGLGPTTGGKVTAGAPSPSSPLAVTAPVNLYFGDPTISNSGVVVRWSGLAPDLIGVYQINGFVPGNHLSGKGSPLPVTLRIGGVSSPTTGANVPLVYVN